MAIDYERIRRFVNSRLAAKNLERVLVRAGFEIKHVYDEEPDRLTWGFHVKPNGELSAVFNQTLETLVWVSEHSEFQARTLQKASSILVNERPRLNEDFAIVFSKAPDAEEAINFASERLEQLFVGLPLSEIESFEPIGARSFRGAMQSRVYSRDVYALTAPVSTNAHFFGRGQLLRELEAALRKGGQHVGLFGLRKMGKTSFLLRLLRDLRSRPGLLVAHVDIQRIEPIAKSKEYFLWALGRALYVANRPIRATRERLRLFGKVETFADLDSGEQRNVPELFRHDLELILAQNVSKKIVLLLDEIQRMWPGAAPSNNGWAESYGDVWRLLRGLDQEYPGRLSYFIAGSAPECLEQRLAAGDENPIFNGFEKRYLPHLDGSARKKLLRDLGRRIGLEWDEGALSFAEQLAAGHPALLRVIGSVIHRVTGPRQGTLLVNRETLQDALNAVLLAMNPYLSQMLGVLEECHPDDFLLLEYLAAGKVGEFQEFAAAMPDAVAHLEGYEIVQDAARQPRITMEALHSWLQRKKAPRTDSEADSGEFRVGELIDDAYEVTGTLGRAGGFGKVYKAIAQSREAVAVKVFHSPTSYSSLLRELEVLESAEHPNVVRILNHGRLRDGRSYMVMEMLEGDLLEKYCFRASRLSPDAAESMLQKLLSALESIHPNPEATHALGGREELSVDELQTLLQAQAGYTHRDIKPQNVIVVKDRGPVLIDFGISSKASSAVLTVSHTPGYLPPDFDGICWTVGVDLYQLGLSILQAVVGTPFDGKSGSVESLRSELRTDSSVPERLKGVLLRLTDADRTVRFRSATEAIAGLR